MRRVRTLGKLKPVFEKVRLADIEKGHGINYSITNKIQKKFSKILKIMLAKYYT